MNTPTPPTEQLRLERVRAEAQAKKTELRLKMKTIAEKRRQLNDDLARVEGAIRSAEQRLTIATAPRADYVNARAQQVAMGLMGQPVTLDEVEKAQDFGASLTADDLTSGIRALKKQRDELVRSVNMSTADARVCTTEFQHSHAVEHGANYQLARNQLVAAFIEVHAASRNCVQLDPMKPITLEKHIELLLPSFADTEPMIALRKNPNLAEGEPTQGARLLQGGYADAAATRINSELMMETQ